MGLRNLVVLLAIFAVSAFIPNQSFAKNQCSIQIVAATTNTCVCSVNGKLVGTELSSGSCVKACGQAAGC